MMLTRALRLLVAGAIVAAPLTCLAADPAPSSVSLEAGTGRVLTLPNPAANVFVADSKVAEVRPASASALFIYGVGAGRTTVAALDAEGGLVSQFNVTVQSSNFGAAQAQAEIARLLPTSHISVRSLPTSLMLSGTAESPSDAAQAVAVAQAFTAEKQTVENQIHSTFVGAGYVASPYRRDDTVVVSQPRDRLDSNRQYRTDREAACAELYLKRRSRRPGGRRLPSVRRRVRY